MPPARGGGGTAAGAAGAARRHADARPSLLDKRKPFFTGLQRFGIGKALYLQDPFHTLLNLPWWKFIIIFFATYMTQFCFFSLIYLAFPPGCIKGINGLFAHALWMSSRTASTIGFGDEIKPMPECTGANLIVMLQVICSNLIDFIMLGLVFARFSAPFKRATSIRFSAVATINRHASGYFALTLRVANIRKHQLLKPEIKVLLTAIDSITPSNYVFEYLPVEGCDMQQMNLQLGFPANVVHVIRPSSPLFNLSLQEMDARMMEVLVFVDGVDAMTSKALQARRSYEPSDMHLNEQFHELHLEMRGGKLGLDFTDFDTTVCSTDELVSEYQASSQLASMSMPELQHHMAHLRHLTFKRLAEQPGRKPGGGGASGGGAPPAGGAGSGHGGTAAGFGGAVELGRVAPGGSPSPDGARRGGRDAPGHPFDQSGNFSSLPL